MSVEVREAVEWLGLAAGVIMPCFNVPLILRMIRRKSSQDLSVTWALGVWSCIILMTPQALVSSDMAFKGFGIVNLFSFSGVVFLVLKYRKHKV